MNMVMALVTLAFLVEGIVDGFKGALSKWAWLALGLGAALGPLSGLDVFEMVGIPLRVPYMGSVLTGIVCGRGASVVYDLWDKLKGAKPPGETV